MPSPPDTPSTTDFQALGDWMAWLEGRGLSEHTLTLYTYGVFRLLRMHRFPALAGITERQILDDGGRP